jgi:2-hydroxychromene-2-carboxylate isomerase
MTRATMYLDLGSPYAYLAAERVQRLFRNPIEFQPVLLGAIFERRGWRSWAETDRREEGMAEVEERARRYDLPPIVWPNGWPTNSLAADRAAVWTQQQNTVGRFVLSLYRREFTHGEDISKLDVLASVAAEVGLDAQQLLQGIQHPDVKASLRRATDEAWELGVRGVPTIRVDHRLFYGDDKLEDAAAMIRT